jgi:predicted  nucleic acid-binding Zn-ribbon protein
MSQSLKAALQDLNDSISRLENTIDQRVEKKSRNQAELFGISEEEKTLNKTIAGKLDSTIKRLETLLTEE